MALLVYFLKCLIDIQERISTVSPPLNSHRPQMEKNSAPAHTDRCRLTPPWLLEAAWYQVLDQLLGTKYLVASTW